MSLEESKNTGGIEKNEADSLKGRTKYQTIVNLEAQEAYILKMVQKRGRYKNAADIIPFAI